MTRGQKNALATLGTVLGIVIAGAAVVGILSRPAVMAEKLNRIEVECAESKDARAKLFARTGENAAAVRELKVGQDAILKRLDSMDATQAQRFDDLKELIRSRPR